jgi:nucleotide-binding universal stress UspA family protein
MRRRLLGSVAAQVVADAPAPVLLASAHFPARVNRGAGHGLHAADYRTILVPLDPSLPVGPVLGKALTATRATSATLVLVSSTPNAAAALSDDALDTLHIAHWAANVQDDLATSSNASYAYDASASALYTGVLSVRRRVVRQYSYKLLLSVCAQVHADLLMLAPWREGRGAHGLASEAVVMRLRHDAALPVLFARATA